MDTRSRRSVPAALRTLALLTVVALALVACGEPGSGTLVTEDRDVAPFTSLDISGAMNVELTVDSTSDQTVTVTFDDNLIDRVITRSAGGTLTVAIEGSISTTGSGRLVSVSVGDMESISLSGASNLEGSGNVDAYTLAVSGASNADLVNLQAETVRLDASGASSVHLFATESATGNASGASAVTVSGRPGDVDIDTSGASDVEVE